MTEHNDGQQSVSIIVPTRNRSALLARLLESLALLRYSRWEVIVVDDGSTDDTPSVVEEYRVRGLPITYLYQPWSKMGAARNLGLRHARGEVAAFTDDDCVVDPGWLEVLARASAAHPEALGVQGRTVTDHGAMTPFTRQVEHLEGGPPYRTCNIAYRAEVLRDLGGFDPELIRGEDVVMAMRVLERGPIVFAPEALVIHPPRPKEWANRHAWRTLLHSELHFRRTYPGYAPARSPTLSLQKAEHVVSRWLILPVQRYWRWHYAYLRRNPRDYLRHVPLIAREKLALFSLLPLFLREWWRLPRGQDEVVGERPLRREDRASRGVRGGPYPPVSVVVPTRNRASLLPRLLASLAAQDYPDHEVVVVDDASEDGTAGILAAWAGEGRRVLRLDAPTGSYAARNRGWRVARGEIVAFTDDDCLPEPGWVSGLAAALQTSAALGVQGLTTASPGEITPFTHQIEQGHPGPPYRTCNIAYRRAVLEQLGGFDDTMRWYADNILGMHARRLGSIGFAPDAIVHHPPRRREWRDRETWLARFQADVVHRRALQALGVEPAIVPSASLPVLLWVVRPLFKQTALHLRYVLVHPIRYLRQIVPMLREKWELLQALRAFWRASPPSSSPTPLPPLSAQPLISVVIVTHDRLELLAETLAALDRQTWACREIVVVDHGGGERTRRLAQGSGARYVLAANVTLAAARQAGTDAARGEIVAFTDDDCLPDPGWLESLVSAFRRQCELCGVQGRTEAEVGPVGSHVVRVFHPDPLFQTCNIAYRRSALELAGGFDLGFAGWFEDTALAVRVLAHGPIGFEPHALVTHRAVPRRLVERERWCVLLADERRLARDYHSFYRRWRGPGFLPTVIARWLLGSPAKALLADLPRARSDPGGYVALIRLLLRERWELVRALRDTYAHHG